VVCQSFRWSNDLDGAPIVCVCTLKGAGGLACGVSEEDAGGIFDSEGARSLFLV
jgi:hypothetical protein